MGDEANMQQLSEPAKKRKKWMELMTKIICPLHIKIAEEKKKRQESYLEILGHIRKYHFAKARGQPHRGHRSDALAEAEKFIKADRKWIAFKGIDEQCQKIENDVSFHTKQENSNFDKSERIAMASVIYASYHCEKELPKLKKVRIKVAKYCGSAFDLKAKEGGKPMTPEIEKNRVEKTEVTDLEKLTAAQDVAKENGLRLI